MGARQGIWAEQIVRHEEEIQSHGLRAEVLVRDTFFDEILQNFLERTFRRADKVVLSLFDHSSDGPLCSLTSKAKLAYAVGLIDKQVLDDLKNMHIIRNRFAHLAKPDFTDAELAKACKKLSAAKGHKVTATNYIDLYRTTVVNCMQYLHQRLSEELKHLQSRLASD
jgi:DNA-binding MltR family transcriptional regulator